MQPVTFFDYSEYGGLPGAVEMCSGLGACRKVLDGTMCPSYMATREEAHSTRGRANVHAGGKPHALAASVMSKQLRRPGHDLVFRSRNEGWHHRLFGIDDAHADAGRSKAASPRTETP